MKYFSILSLFAAIVLQGCGDEPAFYAVNKSIANRQWTYTNKPKFEVNITDPKAQYDLYANIRHTMNYGYSNIFIAVHSQGPGITDSSFRYECILAKADGKWIGNSAANLFERQILLKENFIFPDTGLYSFEIEQQMHANPLRDIADVGFKIIKK